MPKELADTRTKTLDMCMKVHLKKVCLMEKEKNFIKMETLTKEILCMVKSLDRELTDSLMEKCTQAAFTTTRVTELGK